MTNLFGPSNKVVYLKKLVFQSAVRFLILFVLVDAILLSLDLQKGYIAKNCLEVATPLSLEGCFFLCFLVSMVSDPDFL